VKISAQYVSIRSRIAISLKPEMISACGGTISPSSRIMKSGVLPRKRNVAKA
jgi:hypothetical protein